MVCHVLEEGEAGEEVQQLVQEEAVVVVHELLAGRMVGVDGAVLEEVGSQLEAGRTVGVNGAMVVIGGLPAGGREDGGCRRLMGVVVGGGPCECFGRFGGGFCGGAAIGPDLGCHHGGNVVSAGPAACGSSSAGPAACAGPARLAIAFADKAPLRTSRSHRRSHESLKVCIISSNRTGKVCIKSSNSMADHS